MSSADPHSLLVYDPGHFHAALLFFRRNARVDRTVHVYAPPGPDVDAFCAMLEGFNAREEEPTVWRIVRHIGNASLDRLIAERRGGTVILAGRNGSRLAVMRRLHDEGFNILADKPWLTDRAALVHLQAVTAGLPLAVDIMTARHSAVARLRNRIIATPSIFGPLCERDGQPALEFVSRHHLLKMVDGKPLRRPPWFYDVRVQGDGLVDIQSHYVDQAQWIVAEAIAGREHEFDASRDVEMLLAKRWTTAVPLSLFSESTGASEFPIEFRDAVENGVLQLACNGRIDYRLLGLSVRQSCDWGLREAEGGGDTHSVIARGGNAVLTIALGPETGFRTEIRLDLDDERKLAGALADWRQEFPGLACEHSPGGYRLSLPAEMHIRHEEQFPLVLDEFLDLLDAKSFPRVLAARIRARYGLIGMALACAE